MWWCLDEHDRVRERHLEHSADDPRLVHGLCPCYPNHALYATHDGRIPNRHDEGNRDRRHNSDLHVTNASGLWVFAVIRGRQRLRLRSRLEVQYVRLRFPTRIPSAPSRAGPSGGSALGDSTLLLAELAALRVVWCRGGSRATRFARPRALGVQNRLECAAEAHGERESSATWARSGESCWM